MDLMNKAFGPSGPLTDVDYGDQPEAGKPLERQAYCRRSLSWGCRLPAAGVTTCAEAVPGNLNVPSPLGSSNAGMRVMTWHCRWARQATPFHIGPLLPAPEDGYLPSSQTAHGTRPASALTARKPLPRSTRSACSVSSGSRGRR